MRKSTVVLLIAMLLAAVMLFSACGSSIAIDTVKFTKITDGSIYVDEDPAHTTITEVTALKNSTYDDQYGSLFLFYLDEVVEDEYVTKYQVYNADTNKVVFTATDADENYIHIYLARTDTDIPYFVVYTATYAKEDDEINYDKYTETTTIYAADGTLIATANYDADEYSTADLLFFDDKVYKAAENGSFSFLADYPSLAAFPDLYMETEEYYYGVMSNGRLKSESDYSLTLVVYDKDFNVVSTYALPDYAEIATCIILDTDEVLLQYLVEKDPYTEDYDFYEDDTKYSYKTLIIEAEDGKAEEIVVDYCLRYGENLKDEYRANYGLDDSICAIAYAVPITDKHLDFNNARTCFISDDGDLSFLNDSRIEEFYLVAPNLWEVYTSSGNTYLINEDGEIIGDISNAYSNDMYYISETKVYDHTLTEVYNFAANKLEIVDILDKAILFENQDDELILYANGTTTTLIAKDTDRELIDDYEFLNAGFFAIIDYTDEANEKYELYNEAGTKLLTLDYSGYFDLDIVGNYWDGNIMIRVERWDSENFEYTYTYYHIG